MPHRQSWGDSSAFDRLEPYRSFIGSKENESLWSREARTGRSAPNERKVTAERQARVDRYAVVTARLLPTRVRGREWQITDRYNLTQIGGLRGAGYTSMGLRCS